jgi:hypothetical protein
VEEGLLLHRVDLERAHIAVRDLQDAAVVEADLADPVEAGRDQAPVPAGEAADSALGELLVQLSLAGMAREQLGGL